MFAKQVVGALFALQIIAIVVAQSGGFSIPIDSRNVTSEADDYLDENRRIYNATLKSYISQINTLRQNLESEMKVLDKENAQLLKTIRESYERIEPLKLVSMTAKFCVQRYFAEMPYLDTVKASIDSCTTSARNYIATIITTPNNLYTQLNNYYYIDVRNALVACAKSNANPSAGYTRCIKTTVSNVNTYTRAHRNIFSTSIQGSECSLNSRVDVAVSCTYTQYNKALAAIGTVDRLINDCISGYLENKPPCPTFNGTVACPNVLNFEVKESDFQNSTIPNPLKNVAKNQSCLELRYV